MADHSVIVCLGEDVQLELFSGALRPLMACVVPMFFALSGFLVAGSLSRSRSLVTFAGLRALRIVPALAVDTVFCALILGVIMTTAPLRVYFASAEFFEYFLNVFGDIHYHLPGVFRTHPSDMVNEQLWTIPYELKCYAVLTALAVLGLHRRRNWFFAASIAIMLGGAAYVHVQPILVWDVWPLLLPCFLAGVAIFLYQDKLERSWRLMAISSISAIALLYQQGPLMLFAAFPIAYVTVWLGLLRPARDALIKSGDYSYPLFLYSFSIQQTMYQVMPFGRIWWANFLLAILCLRARRVLMAFDREAGAAAAALSLRV